MRKPHHHAVTRPWLNGCQVYSGDPASRSLWNQRQDLRNVHFCRRSSRKTTKSYNQYASRGTVHAHSPLIWCLISSYSVSHNLARYVLRSLTSTPNRLQSRRCFHSSHSRSVPPKFPFKPAGKGPAPRIRPGMDAYTEADLGIQSNEATAKQEQERDARIARYTADLKIIAFVLGTFKSEMEIILENVRAKAKREWHDVQYRKINEMKILEDRLDDFSEGLELTIVLARAEEQWLREYVPKLDVTYGKLNEFKNTMTQFRSSVHQLMSKIKYRTSLVEYHKDWWEWRNAALEEQAGAAFKAEDQLKADSEDYEDMDHSLLTLELKRLARRTTSISKALGVVPKAMPPELLNDHINLHCYFAVNESTPSLGHIYRNWNRLSASVFFLPETAFEIFELLYKEPAHTFDELSTQMEKYMKIKSIYFPRLRAISEHPSIRHPYYGFHLKRLYRGMVSGNPYLNSKFGHGYILLMAPFSIYLEELNDFRHSFDYCLTLTRSSSTNLLGYMEKFQDILAAFKRDYWASVRSLRFIWIALLHSYDRGGLRPEKLVGSTAAMYRNMKTFRSAAKRRRIAGLQKRIQLRREAAEQRYTTQRGLDEIKISRSTGKITSRTVTISKKKSSATRKEASLRSVSKEPELIKPVRKMAKRVGKIRVLRIRSSSRRGLVTRRSKVQAIQARKKQHSKDTTNARSVALDQNALTLGGGT